MFRLISVKQGDNKIHMDGPALPVEEAAKLAVSVMMQAAVEKHGAHYCEECGVQVFGPGPVTCKACIEKL